MENKFIIAVPVFNAKDYIIECLESILQQNYSNFELCVMDDHSDDGTWELIGKVCDDYNACFNICRNDHRLGSPLANLVKGIELFSFDREDVVVTVDGDDKLATTSVLGDLNEVYQDTGVWMTYGQFVPLSGNYPPYCKEIPDTRTYRRSGQWLASHLRTFKKKLWDKIDDRDLRGEDGKYYQPAGDVAVMYPIIEMCGHTHLRFIEKVNYIYNDLSPLNEMKTVKSEQLRVAQEIRNKYIYDELTEL